MRTGVIAGLAVVLWSAPRAWSLDPSRAISQYAMRHWTAEDGLHNESVMALAQTKDRYVWVGTQDGLARFDGIRFTYFGRETHPEFRSSFVFALLADRDGGLWVGTRGGGVVEIRDGVLRNYGKAEGLPDDTIIALAQAPDGAIWVGTLSDGLARIDRGKVTATLTPRNGLPGGAVRSLAFGPKGELWVALADAGLVRIDGGRIHLFTKADGFPSRKARTLYANAAGEVWVATMDAGLFRFANGVFTAYRGHDGFDPPLIRALHQDRDGNLWIGTDGQGPARLTKGRITTLRGHRYFPATADVWSIIEDHEGTVWIGSDHGALTQLRNGKILTYTTLEGLASNAVTAVESDRSGNVWVASFEGVSRLTGSSFQSVDLGESGLAVFSLHADDDGTLWAGTGSGTVIRISPDRTITTYGESEGLPGGNVFAIYRDPAGTLWIGTASGLARMTSAGRFVLLTKTDGLGANVVRFIHRDAKGVLWVATDGAGLNRYVNGRFTHWGTKQGFPTDFVRSIHEDADGVLWVGTGGAGLLRVESGRVWQYTTRQGLPHDNIYAIVEDRTGNLWCSTGRGIMSVSRRELNDLAAGRRSRIEPTVYGRAAGLVSLEGVGGIQSSGARSRDGRIWFTTGAGVAEIDRRRLHRDPIPPAVYIEQASLDQRPLDVRDGTALPPGSRSIELRFTALNYTAPADVTFRYRLEGFDDRWIAQRESRSAVYTNLRPGTYRFHVIAANADGVWNETGDTFEFRLLPFFYQTVWFRLLLLALGIAVVMQIIRVRVRLLNAEAAARTAMMEESLTRGHKLQSLGQLASGIAHEFNNTMMMALPWAEALRKSRGEDALVEKATRNIRDACLRAKEITSQLLDFAQPRPPKIEAVDLHELVTEQIGLIRPSLGPGYEVVLREDARVPRVKADSSQMRQVIVNLALNARDAMPTGGVVTFEIRRMSDQEQRLWGAESQDCVVLTVSDTGKGMDEETKNRIFDPFFTTKDIGYGTGLGLSIVHRIVEQHGGRIIIDTGEHGTSVHIVFGPADRHEERRGANVEHDVG